MHYTYPVLYLEDNETFLDCYSNYSSNATGLSITDFMNELCDSNISVLDLWWIVPIIVITVWIINLYPLR